MMTLSDSQINAYRLKDLHTTLLVLINGRLVPSLSDYETLQKETIITAEKGFALTLPPHCVLSSPIHMLSIITHDAPVELHADYHFTLGENSALTLLEETLSFATQACTIHTENHVQLNQRAQLKHYKKQCGLKTACYTHYQVRQAQDSQTTFVHYTVDCQATRDQLTVSLEAPDAMCFASGFYYATHPTQTIEQRIAITHHVSRCKSNMLYKGIAGHQARIAFEGRVIVKPSAQQTEALQMNHHLLLSDRAEATAKPILEIAADDVICKHGSTTGHPDEAALFYLRSRGLSEKQALQLLLQGFSESVLKRVESAPIRHHLNQNGWA